MDQTSVSKVHKLKVFFAPTNVTFLILVLVFLMDYCVLRDRQKTINRSFVWFLLHQHSFRSELVAMAPTVSSSTTRGRPSPGDCCSTINDHQRAVEQPACCCSTLRGHWGRPPSHLGEAEDVGEDRELGKAKRLCWSWCSSESTRSGMLGDVPTVSLTTSSGSRMYSSSWEISVT